MLPGVSPVVVPSVVCSTCGCQMRVVVRKIGTGAVSGVTAYCDSEKCKYGYELQFTYACGTAAPSYVAGPEQVKINPDAPKFVPQRLAPAEQERPNPAAVAPVLPAPAPLGGPSVIG